jgi:GGDEF domain-containing protein
VEEIRKFATELAVNNRKLQQAVMTDPLTGLPNRRYALDRLEQEVAAAKRRSGSLAIMIVDIDHFKKVNDQFGHETINLVTMQVTRYCAMCPGYYAPRHVCKMPSAVWVVKSFW